MNDATDESGCRPTDPEWMRQVAKDNTTENVKATWVDDSCPEGPFETECEKAYREYWAKQGLNVTTKPALTTPRVAESLDDLAVGMWVAVHWRRGRISGGQIESTAPGEAVVRGKDDVLTLFPADFAGNDILGVVILADPPAPPTPDWLVPADTMEALREALPFYWPLYHAARAVLDAAKEVERP